jgi:hypothetical protein
VVRFARLIHRRGRVLGGPSARAAFGGNLRLPWLPPTVVPQKRTGRAGTGTGGPVDLPVVMRAEQWVV